MAKRCFGTIAAGRRLEGMVLILMILLFIAAAGFLIAWNARRLAALANEKTDRNP